MTDPTGATPPRDDDPNSTGQQPPAGQPTGEPWGQQPAGVPDGQQPPAAPAYGAPTGQEPPAAPVYGQQPPAGQPYGAPTGEPYGQQPPAGQPYGQQPPAGQPYGAPAGQPYGAPAGQPYGAPAGQPYGAPQESPTTAISEGFTWSWNKFTQNAGPLIGGLAVYAAGLVVLSIIFFAITIGAATAASNNRYGGAAAGVSLVTTMLFVALVVLFAVFVQAGLIRAVTEVMRTGRTSFGTFFKFERLGTVLLAALLVGIGNAVGSMVLYIGGIVFGFFAQFTLFYVIDKGVGAVDAIKASFQLAARNFAPAALLYLVALVASAVGGALCGIGALVTTPIAMLLTGFVFRRLHGEGVAA